MKTHTQRNNRTLSTPTKAPIPMKKTGKQDLTLARSPHASLDDNAAFLKALTILLQSWTTSEMNWDKEEDSHQTYAPQLQQNKVGRHSSLPGPKEVNFSLSSSPCASTGMQCGNSRKIWHFVRNLGSVLWKSFQMLTRSQGMQCGPTLNVQEQMATGHITEELSDTSMVVRWIVSSTTIFFRIGTSAPIPTKFCY